MKHLAIIAASLFTVSVVMSSCATNRYGMPRNKYDKPLPHKKFVHNPKTEKAEVFIAKH